jgi:hypothetical protein
MAAMDEDGVQDPEDGEENERMDAEAKLRKIAFLSSPWEGGAD